MKVSVMFVLLLVGLVQINCYGNEPDPKQMIHSLINTFFTNMASCHKGTVVTFENSYVPTILNNLNHALDINDCITASIDIFMNQTVIPINETLVEHCSLPISQALKYMNYDEPRYVITPPQSCNMGSAVPFFNVMRGMNSYYDDAKLIAFATKHTHDIRQLFVANHDLINCMNNTVLQKSLLHDETCYDNIDAVFNTIKHLITHALDDIFIKN